MNKYIYFFLKIFSYTPVLNIVGSDSEFGDISRESAHIRISLLGFTIIYHLSLFSFYYDIKSKKLNFNIFNVIKYPIKKVDQSTIDTEINGFKKSIKSVESGVVDEIKDTILHRIAGQGEVIKTSFSKASIILPIFIALLIYFIDQKIIKFDYSNIYFPKLVILYLLLFCLMSVSINLFFFILKLTKVTRFTEISIAKPSTFSKLKKDVVVEYYTKYRYNDARSTNIVSYNIWIRDYFNKFVLYFLLFIIISSVTWMKSNEINIVEHTIIRTLVFEENSMHLKDYESLKEITESKCVIYILYPLLDTLNSRRVQNIESFLNLHTEYKSILFKLPISNSNLGKDKFYIIMEEGIK